MAQTVIGGGFLNTDLVSAQTALTTGLVSTDELIISDAGVLKRMDISVLEDYIVTNLGDNNIDVTQSSHGFAVGDIIRLTTTDNTYAKALADTAANAETVGVVIDVTDSNNFTYATSGEITVATAVPNSTTAGDIVFLSPSSAGAVTTTEPTTTNQISKPLAVITEANNKMILLPYRGEIISGGATSFAPVDATYLALSANGTLTGERVLTAGTGITLTDAGAGGAATLTIDNDSITFAKMQNVAANSVLIRNANSSGDLAELALATTQILIGNGTGFTAAALSGEATMTNAGVVSIADNIIDEANLKVSNGPTNGQVLTARSGNTGGMTWEAAASGGVDTTGTPADNQIAVFTDADTLEGTSGLTFTSPSYLTLENSASGSSTDFKVYSSATSGATPARLILRTAAGNTADTFISFHGVDSYEYSIGVDNSDSDKFKISGSALGTSDKIAIKTDGRIVLNPTSATNPTGGSPLSIKAFSSNHVNLELFTSGSDEDSGYKMSTYERGSGGSSGDHSYVQQSYTQIIPTGAGASRGGIVFVHAESDGDTTSFCDMVVVPVTGGFSNANYSPGSSSTAGTGNVIFRLNMRGSPPNRDYQLGAHNTLYMATSSGNWNVVTMTMALTGIGG